MARPPSGLSRKIVTAAAKRFLHDGVDGASLREIARDAKTSLGMVYYYFPTKDDLFLAVVERRYAPFAERLVFALATEGSFDDRVRALFDAVAAMTPAEFDGIRLMLREGMVSSERLARVLGRMMHGHLPAMLALVQEGFARGNIDAGIPPAGAMLALMALAIFPQVMMRRIAGAGAEAPLPLPTHAAMAEALAGVALRGFAGVKEPGKKARR